MNRFIKILIKMLFLAPIKFVILVFVCSPIAILLDLSGESKISRKIMDYVIDFGIKSNST